MKHAITTFLAAMAITHAAHAQTSTPPPRPYTFPIVAGKAFLDQDASMVIYPQNDSGLLLKNGNFSKPDIGAYRAADKPGPGGSKWRTFHGIPGWTAIGGSLVEIQKIVANPGGQYCELDSHQESAGRSAPSNHGIQQTVSLSRGHYILVFDYRARDTRANDFVVRVEDSTLGVKTLVTKKNAAANWKRGWVHLDVVGNAAGDDEKSSLTFKFDISDEANTYGVFIDNVMLLPIPVEFQARDKFSVAFDPPLEDDEDPRGIPDEYDWVPWTSLGAKSPKSPTHVNTATKVVFGAGVNPNDFEILPGAGFGNLIKVEPKVPSGNVTNLKITALSDLEEITPAVVEVRSKADRVAVAKMKVKILPGRKTVQCRFFKLLDSRDVLGFDADNTRTPGARWQSPSNVGLGDDQVGEIDSRFVQAGINATKAGPEVAGKTGAGRFGLREFQYVQKGLAFIGITSKEDLNAIDRSRNLFTSQNEDGKDCIFVYVPYFDSALSSDTFAFYDDITGFVFVNVGAWYIRSDEGVRIPLPDDQLQENAEGASYWGGRVLAHEFGHWLNLSSRWYLHEQEGGPLSEPHDMGPYPKGTVSLMRPGNLGPAGRWLRHEDWEAASKRAFERGL